MWRTRAPMTRPPLTGDDRVAEVGDAVDVDERRRRREPQFHERDQALAAGQHLPVVAVLVEVRDGIVERRGRQILEAGRVHESLPPAGTPGFRGPGRPTLKMRQRIPPGGLRRVCVPHGHAPGPISGATIRRGGPPLRLIRARFNRRPVPADNACMGVRWRPSLGVGTRVRRGLSGLARRSRLAWTGEEQLRLAMAASRMGTFEWDLKTHRGQFSPELEAIHGLAPGEFDGSREALLDLVHPDDRESFLAGLRRGGGAGHEIRVRVPDRPSERRGPVANGRGDHPERTPTAPRRASWAWART